MTERLATKEEVADYLAVHPKTLDKWAGAGRGPVYTKLEGTRRYDWTDVRAWVEAHKVVR